MKLTKRRVTVGLISTAVVVAMTSVTTWALAETSSKPAASTKPVRLIVGYKDGARAAAAEARMSALGARRTASGAGQQALTELDATTIEVPATQSAATIASLRSDPNVAYVEVDRVRKAFETTPDDPIYDRQPEMREVRANIAWDTTTGSAVTIAVLDTGVTATGDLAGATVAGYDFVNNDASPTDDQGHGTAVASLIAARGNNSAGMAGVCWSCRIMPVKVLDARGDGYDSDIAKGIIWAVQKGAKVINMSLGGAGTSKALTDAVAYANMNSVLVVAAAGNGTGTVPQYPAALTDVVGVGATARCPNFDTSPLCTTGTNALDSYSARNSSSGRWVDVAAPGNVVAMDRSGNYNTGTTGTSFASPLV
ncbi:MAG: S8 family serine peptidase, partial [Actinoplanes sp.]